MIHGSTHRGRTHRHTRHVWSFHSMDISPFTCQFKWHTTSFILYYIMLSHAQPVLPVSTNVHWLDRNWNHKCSRALMVWWVMIKGTHSRCGFGLKPRRFATFLGDFLLQPHPGPPLPTWLAVSKTSTKLTVSGASQKASQWLLQLAHIVRMI